MRRTYSKHPANRFAALIGTFLLVEGIWGLFSSVVFGVFTTNRLHAIIHIVLGLVGLGTASRSKARGFLWFLGILLLAVGIGWFVPSSRDLVVRTLAVNQAVAVLNIAVGAVSLFFALRAPNSLGPVRKI
jgi:uncharacterized membrane protein